MSNIAGDSPQYRDFVLQHGAMQPLLQNLMRLSNKQHQSTMRRHTWALSNFCCGRPQPPFELVSPALPTLARLLLSTDDDETLADACRSLAVLSHGTSDRIQEIIKAGACWRIVNLLRYQIVVDDDVI